MLLHCRGYTATKTQCPCRAVTQKTMQRCHYCSLCSATNTATEALLKLSRAEGPSQIECELQGCLAHRLVQKSSEAQIKAGAGPAGRSPGPGQIFTWLGLLPWTRAPPDERGANEKVAKQSPQTRHLGERAAFQSFPSNPLQAQAQPSAEQGGLHVGNRMFPRSATATGASGQKHGSARYD